MSFTPACAPAHVPPFNDVTDNNPCAKKAVTSVNGVDVSAEALCMFHWINKHGQQDYTGVIVKEP